MEKKKLSLRDLKVVSFATGPVKSKGGTAGSCNCPPTFQFTCIPELCTAAQVCY
jgi:hypothetical protein